MRLFLSLLLASSLFSMASDELAEVFQKQNRAFVSIYLEHDALPKNQLDQVAYTQLLQDAVLEDELAFGFTVVRRFQSVPALAGWIDPVTYAAWVAKKKSGLSAINSIDLDVGGKTPDLPAGGAGGLAESVSVIGADTLQQMGITGDAIEIAVLDTGFDSDHGDLQQALLSESCFCFVPNGGCCPDGTATQTGAGSAEDDHGHGTHVTGIITSNGMVSGKGVAPNARITAVKMLDSSNSFNSTSDIVAGLDWVHNNRPDVKVVSMSIFTFARFASACDTEFSWTMALFTAVQNLVDRGVTVVTISGNDGVSGELPVPGCLSNLITVGATNKSDGMFTGSNSHPDVDLLAPGVNVVSSIIGGSSTPLTGTSMACPHVSGTAALFLQANPTLTQADIMDALIQTGTPITDRHGITKPRINVKQAYDLLFAKNDNFTAWLPHITSPTGGFKTFINIFNNELILKRDEQVELVPFDAAGNRLNSEFITLQSQQILREDAAILFGGERVSHVGIIASENVHVNAAYQADVPNAATAHVPDFRLPITRLVFEPAQWDQVFDGMALVNVGDQESTVTVGQYGDDGTLLNLIEYTSDQLLGVNQKLLVLFSADFDEIPGSYFRVISSQPAQMVLLRGTYPGTSPAYLYQTVPVESANIDTILKKPTP